VVIIAHGSSSALAVQNAIRVGLQTVEQKVNPHIEQALAALAEQTLA
jgi:phosphate acyltransferase